LSSRRSISYELFTSPFVALTAAAKPENALDGPNATLENSQSAKKSGQGIAKAFARAQSCQTFGEKGRAALSELGR
jgi:hypothetical protein